MKRPPSGSPGEAKVQRPLKLTRNGPSPSSEPCVHRTERRQLPTTPPVVNIEEDVFDPNQLEHLSEEDT